MMNEPHSKSDTADAEQAQARIEKHEIANSMRPVWISFPDVISPS